MGVGLHPTSPATAPGVAPSPRRRLSEDELMRDEFLHRWSRRKRASQCTPGGAPLGEADAPAGWPPEPLDLAELPAVADLCATSDYTAFLKKGVPSALRLAALRRAWTTDPVISGHRSLADYDWDFNAPGYGRLRPGDQPAKLISALFDHLRTVPTRENSSAPAGPDPEGGTRDGPPKLEVPSPGGSTDANSEIADVASDTLWVETGADPLKVRNKPTFQ